MDKAIALKLPDELYEVFRRQAASGGRTADELAAVWIEHATGRGPGGGRTIRLATRPWSN